ncbi:MAG: hypothetical protein ACRD3W_11195, partial [Terriglobales bacterium]
TVVARAGGLFSGFLSSLLSPMSLSVFFASFGLMGLSCGFAAPALGALSLVPSVATGLVSSAAFKRFMRWYARASFVTSSADTKKLVGQIAEVNIPIPDHRTGEVTFIVHSKRLNSAAKACDGKELKKGTKVVIVEVQDHLVLVTPTDL